MNQPQAPVHAKTWQVEIFVTEKGQYTHAAAVLHTSAGTVLRHTGVARRNPADPDVPEIGDELAVSRALMGLAQDLFEATVADVEQNTGAAAELSL
jgi:hypothetical protein